MEFKKTARGFEIAEFDDRSGERCSVQQSSAIGDDPIHTGHPGSSFLWVGIADPSVKIFPGNNTGWHDYTLPENVMIYSRMHLDRQQVRDLVNVLSHWLETGRVEEVAKLAERGGV